MAICVSGRVVCACMWGSGGNRYFYTASKKRKIVDLFCPSSSMLSQQAVFTLQQLLLRRIFNSWVDHCRRVLLQPIVVAATKLVIYVPPRQRAAVPPRPRCLEQQPFVLETQGAYNGLPKPTYLWGYQHIDTDDEGTP